MKCTFCGHIWKKERDKLVAKGVLDINTVFAGILLLTGFALVLDWVVGLVERRLMVWQPRAGETERV